MNSSYSALVISPLRSLARSARISLVCGKEPMVVVGSSGRPRASRCLLTLGAGRLAHEVGVGQLADALGDGRVGGDAGAVEQRLVGGELGGCLLGVLVGVGQDGDFLELVELLDGEREVLEHFGREAGLAFGAERHVQQGAGGGYGHVGGDLLQRVDQAEADGVVVAPDVAAVDHAGEDGGVFGDAVLLDGGEVLVVAFVEVEADAVEAEQVDGFVHVGDMAEVGVEQHLDGPCGQAGSWRTGS